MKNINKLLVIVLVLLLCIVFIPRKTVSITYTDENSISLEANELPDLNEEEYSKVKEITIRTALPEQNTLDLLTQLTNLEAININNIDINDITFLNNITPNNEITLRFVRTTIDLKNINNEHITSLNIGNSVVKNFKDVENLTSLKELTFSEMVGYQKLDYTKFPNLNTLALTSYIDNFSELIDSIPNVTSLSLAATNIQNKDTVYLKELTNLTYLNLNQTFLTDIDFVSSLPNLEELVLPWSVTDLSPIYNLHNLKKLDWEAYTELFVTNELVNYLDSHNINHFDYDPNIRTKINNIISELNINENTNPKVALEKITRYIVEHTGTDLNNITGNSSVLDILINQHMGVCYHHSSAIYTIAKVLGIDDIYATSGIIMHLTDIHTGNAFNDVIDHNFYVAHGWNIINIDGVWYGLDAAQMNQGTFALDEELFNANFLKNPLKDDEYDYNYAMDNYYDFNYYFYARHAETDGILTQTQTFEFKDINGLNIKNHIIHDYDVNDTNATNLCNKVLDNYNCNYQDTDNNGSISNGDKVVITKNNVEVDTFTISTSSYVAPVKKHLGKPSLEYANNPNEAIDYIVNDYYFNKKNPLKVKLKGENYDNNETYETKIEIIDIETDKAIYTDTKNITGKNINDGFYHLVEGSKVLPKKEIECPSYGCQPDYLINISVNDEKREIFIEYKKAHKETFNITIDENENILIATNNVIEVEENSDKEIELSAKLGYKIISIKVNDIESIDNYKDNKITIKNITKDIKITVEAIPEQYAFTEGNDAIYLNKELTFKINGPLELFKDLYINKKLIDPINYKLESGSTIITLSNEYLNSLSNGEYTMIANYSNGTSAKAIFIINNSKEEIKPEEKKENKENNPKTHDEIIIYCIISIVALIGFVIAFIYRKKLNKKIK